MILNEETATWFTLQTAAVPAGGEFHLVDDDGVTLCGRALEITNEEFKLLPLCAVCNGLSTPEDVQYAIGQIAEFFQEDLEQYRTQRELEEDEEERRKLYDRRDDSDYWRED